MDETVAKKFATQLRKWRIARNMTQHDLSVLCGISQQSLSAIEHGDAMARRSTMVAIIEKGFEMHPKRFFTEEPRGGGRIRHRVSGVPVPYVRMWRARVKLSSRELAERAGVSMSTINHIENDGRASVALANRIAFIFGKTLEEMADAPDATLRGDASESILKGKSIEQFADEIYEEFVQPIRQGKAEKKLDKTMADLGLSTPPKKRAISKANEAGVVTASHEQIMAWLRADAEEARAGRPEEDDEEDDEEDGK